MPIVLLYLAVTGVALWPDRYVRRFFGNTAILALAVFFLLSYIADAYFVPEWFYFLGMEQVVLRGLWAVVAGAMIALMKLPRMIKP